jgi:ribosomal protein S14
VIGRKERRMSEEAPLTLSVPEAGKRYFGLCRNAAYDAAARGEIPTIKIGRLLRVPIRALEAMLDRASEPAA